MAAVTIWPSDLEPFATIPVEKAMAMIDDALAIAAQAAPCILESTFDAEKAKAAKAIIRGAVLRWNEAGTGAIQSQTAGPFGMTTTTPPRRGMFWPSEIDDLRKLCQGDETSGVFAIDTLTQWTGIVHADICALNFGAVYCSCGAVLTQNFPLYEGWA